MPAPSASWNLVRVYGTWRNMNGTMKSGTYRIAIPVRVTNTTDDSIIPAGVFTTGDLSTVEGNPSMSVMVPSTNDPDIAETGFKIQVTVTFADANPENYVLDVPYSNRPTADGGNNQGVNLRTIVITPNFPQLVANYKVGVAGGLALLNSAGQVVDANGNVGTGGGGVTVHANLTGLNADDHPQYHNDTRGDIRYYTKTLMDGLLGSKSNTEHTHVANDISNASTVGKAVLTAADAAAARTAIGAGTGNSSLVIGTTSTTAKAGNYQPASTDISDATTVGRAVLTAADAAAARAAIGAGTGSSTVTSLNITDATTVGRQVLTAADAASARTALGVSSGGTANFYVVRYSGGAYPALPGSKPAGVEVVVWYGPSAPTTIPAWVGTGSSQALGEYTYAALT